MMLILILIGNGNVRVKIEVLRVSVRLQDELMESVEIKYLLVRRVPRKTRGKGLNNEERIPDEVLNENLR
jgi:hypothetical protein